MSDLISRQVAIDALRVAYWDDNIQSAKDDPCIVDAMTDWAIRQVKALPPAQLEPCNYVNACNELAMNNTSSTYGYFQILKEFEKYGYILVDAMGNIR